MLVLPADPYIQNCSATALDGSWKDPLPMFVIFTSAGKLEGEREGTSEGIKLGESDGFVEGADDGNLVGSTLNGLLLEIRAGGFDGKLDIKDGLDIEDCVGVDDGIEVL